MTAREHHVTAPEDRIPLRQKSAYAVGMLVNNLQAAALPAMVVILKMKEPVDRFFDDVMVMADDEKVRNNRLSLLTAISHLFLRIGDFSKMS